MRWIAIEAISQGHAADAGMPPNGRNKNATRPAPTEINVVVDNGSRPTLISAFQPAWQAAANKTARKTAFSISARNRSFDATMRLHANVDHMHLIDPSNGELI